MKTRRLPAIILGMLYLGFLGYLAFSAPQLPDRVATHFNFAGQPDGWMSRSEHLVLMAIFGLAFPAFIAGIFSLCRLFPQGLNIPHRDYWLAPERRDETFAYFQRLGLWMACLFLCFAIGLHFAIVRTNYQPDPRLSTSLILGLAGSLIAGSIGLIIGMVLHFNSPQPEQ